MNHTEFILFFCQEFILCFHEAYFLVRSSYYFTRLHLLFVISASVVEVTLGADKKMIRSSQTWHLSAYFHAENIKKGFYALWLG